MIELKDFCKSYKNTDFSLKDINLKIEKGRIIGLLGANGSGKTTILKAICGFHHIDSGKILLTTQNGTVFDINQSPENSMKFTGYVPEIPLLPKEMYVHEFLEYAAKMHGIQTTEIPARIQQAAKDCSIEKLLSKKIKTLSKGQRQRVSFAQALIYNPENLILDEPISGLDPAQITQMRNLIKKLSKTKAVLLSTHILHEISELCDEVYILSKGKLTKADESGNLEAQFIKLSEEAE